MSILIKNGQVIDPATQKDEISDVLIENGVITRVEKGIRVKDAQVIDAKGCYVMPGIIDMHVHLRDPGQTYKEDIESGSKAAAKGGVTTLVAMPNTKPVIDSPDRVNYVTIKADRFSPINVLQAGAITVGQKGEELADIEGMVKAGIPAISEDGKSVMNALLYKEAMEIAAEKNIPVLAHCEDKNLVNGGCMNEDANSREWHLPGITNSVENTIVARDIVLAAETGAHLHLCHCSTKESVDMVREARKAGVSISAEVCPHHFTLCSDDIVKGDTNYKMNPPLRTKEDLEALRQGLKDDVFDVISTDHAPHALAEKQESFKKAPFGIVGLETSVALTCGYRDHHPDADGGEDELQSGKNPAPGQERFSCTWHGRRCGCHRSGSRVCDRSEGVCFQGQKHSVRRQESQRKSYGYRMRRQDCIRS